jgi:hypothetical protein
MIDDDIDNDDVVNRCDALIMDHRADNSLNDEIADDEEMIGS